MSKQKSIATKAELDHGAHVLLAQDPTLHWHWKKRESKSLGTADAVLELALDNRRLLFDVDFKLEPTARDTEWLAEQKGRHPCLLIAPYLSETLVTHCRDRGLNCLDLNGRLWVHADGVLVDRRASPETRVRPRRPPPDVFSSKSSRLARTLLNHPERSPTPGKQGWRQNELVAHTGLSPGLVSRLVRHFLNEGLLETDDGRVFVKRPDALLNAWARHDHWERRTTIHQYSVLEGDLFQLARKLQTIFTTGQRLVFTQWFAANLRHPYTIVPIVSAYVSFFEDRQVELGLGGRSVADGGRLWLIVPEDAGVFQETQLVEGFTLACDWQIYLDLLQVGLRGPDQAKELREWEDFGKVSK